MLPLLLIALAADPEPPGDAPKVIARAPWTHTRPAGDVTGKDQVQLVLRSAAELVAALHEVAAEIVKEAAKTGRSVREVAKRRKLMTDEELDRALDVLALTRGGIA